MVSIVSPRRFFPRPAPSAVPSGSFRLAAALLLLAGCGSLNAYRTESVLLHSPHTIIENFANSNIDPQEVDQLLLEVAEILEVRLDPKIPKARIVVASPDRIARFYSAGSAAFPGHAVAAALYFPGASLVLIPYFDRTILGHELAHYLTDHYLKAPRAHWEPIARSVEWKLMTAKPRPTGAQKEIVDRSQSATEASVPSVLASDRPSSEVRSE